MGGVERQVRRPRPLHRQQRDQQVVGARDPDRDEVAGADPEPPQLPGQPAGGHVELGVGQRAGPRSGRPPPGGVFLTWAANSSGRVWGGWVTSVSFQVTQEFLPVGGRDDVEVAEGGVRLGGGVGQEGSQGVPEPDDRRGVERLGVVAQPGAEAVDHLEVQWAARRLRRTWPTRR